MKLAVSVVLYNPSKENIDHLFSLGKIFDNVYILDNSNTANDKLVSKGNLHYIPYFENNGIAFALEDGLSRAIEDKNDFLLTLDQDSIYPVDKHSEIVSRLRQLDMSKDAVFALTTNSDYASRDNRDEEKVTNCITSGNFLNLKLIQEHDIHFPVELFIDYVDFEFCRRVLSKDLNIIQSHQYYINHTIGSPLRKNILGIKFTCMNHSPTRYYYRFRNAYYLKKQFPKFYKHLAFKTLFVDKLKMKLFEENKKEKSKMIKQGIIDAKKSKLGKLNN